jgi:hypothetical protein
MNARSLVLSGFAAFLLAACGPASTPEKPAEPGPSTGDGIQISEPVSGSVVGSPLVVKGEARGMWFFEASLPVLLTDTQGNVIAQSHGTAEGEWMTEAFVPFTAEIAFTTAETDGFLLVRKDNPSGLPENDAEIRIPVRFKN